MNNQNYSTPIEQLFFRSSKIGLLAGGIDRYDLTPAMIEEKQKLEQLKITPQGLTEKQQSDLDSWIEKINLGKHTTECNSKICNADTGLIECHIDHPDYDPKAVKGLNKIISQGIKLSETKGELIAEYQRRLKEPKELSEKQTERLAYLVERDKMKPSLSDGAKTFVKDVWLENEKVFREEIIDKKLSKGLQGEESAISLISIVDGVMYMKNEKKVFKGNISGTCDVNTFFKDLGERVIDDTKCSWNPKTFMSAKMTSLYEWQGRCYMYLYDAEYFRLRYCLVDCPPDVLADEYKKFCFNHGIVDDSLACYKPLLDQFNSNFLYEHSGKYNQKERVKTFQIVRDLEKEKTMLAAVELAVEYYKTITLNMID